MTNAYLTTSALYSPCWNLRIVFCRCSLLMSPLRAAHFMPCADSLNTVSCVRHTIVDVLTPCKAYAGIGCARKVWLGCRDQYSPLQVCLYAVLTVWGPWSSYVTSFLLNIAIRHCKRHHLEPLLEIHKDERPL